VTSSDITFWSLIATLAIAALNVALIPLIKSAMQGQVEKLKGHFDVMIETHNVSQYAHPAMTRAARDEVDRVADSAQTAAAGVAKIAQEAAADVAKTAQEAVSKVAKDAAESVSGVRDGISTQFKEMRGEIHALRQDLAAFRLEVAEWKPRAISRAKKARES
jgi:hypothetical protein